MNQSNRARLLGLLSATLLSAPMSTAWAQTPIPTQESASTQAPTPAPAAPPAQALAPNKLYEKLSPSVWRIIGFDAQKKAYGEGSGVVVAADTIVTNCHVLVRGRYFIVSHDKQRFEATLAYADPSRDMCQLQVRNLRAPAVTMGDADKLAVGQRIYALGNPLGLELTLSDGLISALRKDNAAKSLVYIQVSAPISPGSSGGGLFDEEGRLVGITTAGFDKGQNLNLAIPINWLKELPARSASSGMVRFLSERKTFEEAAAAAALAASAPRPAAPMAPAPGAPEIRQPATSSAVADLNNIDQFRRASNRPAAEENYRKFLTYVLPRAIAVSDDGHTWATYSSTPADANAPKEPAARAIWACEREYRQHCALYAVDNVVVYRPRRP